MIIGTILASTYILSICAAIPEAIHTKYVQIHQQVSINETETSHFCKPIYPTVEFLLAYKTALNTIQVLIPLTTVSIFQTLMFLKIKRQSKRFSSASGSRRASLIQVTTTFRLVVVSFFILILPPALCEMIYYYVAFFHPMLLLEHQREIEPWLEYCNVIRMFNSSFVNPLLYGNVHVKMFHGIKRILKKTKTSTRLTWMNHLSKPFTKGSVPNVQRRDLHTNHHPQIPKDPKYKPRTYIRS